VKNCSQYRPCSPWIGFKKLVMLLNLISRWCFLMVNVNIRYKIAFMKYNILGKIDYMSGFCKYMIL